MFFVACVVELGNVIFLLVVGRVDWVVGVIVVVKRQSFVDVVVEVFFGVVGAVDHTEVAVVVV